MAAQRLALIHDPDVSAADFWVDADLDWQVLATQGPAGHEAYATVRFDPIDAEPYRDDPSLVAQVTRLAGAFTSTPDHVWFALWDGWGDLEGGARYGTLPQNGLFGRVYRLPGETVPPAFERSVLSAPRVDLAGDRRYLLFRGPVDDVGAWGARPVAPDWPRSMPGASLTWPADRAWSIAADVDPDWFTVGGSRALIDAVLADPTLDAVAALYGVLESHRPDPDREENA